MSTKRERARRLAAERREEKRLSSLSDAKFSEDTRNKYGFDPMAGKPPEAKPYDGTEKLISRFKKQGNVKDIDLARELAISKAASEFLERSEVDLRPEIIDMINRKLVSRITSQREAAKATKLKKQAVAFHKLWQGKADEIWQRHPYLSKNAVAMRISRDGSDHDPDWIRRVIAKRK
jgi:hypothetical protein